MQLDRRQVDLQQPHVLHDQRIGSGIPDIPGDAAGFLKFAVVQDGIQRHQHAGVVAVGVCAERRDLADLVAGVGTRAEGRAADVDGVGSVVDGLDAELPGLGGGEQFQRLLAGVRRYGVICHGVRARGSAGVARVAILPCRTRVPVS